MLAQSLLAPEYALDEVLHPASDMYSLGCLLYAVHCKGSPPFKNHGHIGGVRDNAGKPLTGMDRLDPDLRGKYCGFPYVYRLLIAIVTSSAKYSHHEAFT